MGGLLAMVYGVVVYLVFFASFLYAIVFVGNIAELPGGLLVPKTIDSGAVGAPIPSLIVDAILLSIFAVQHSLMARRGFKRAWTRIVPPSVERSTYVLLSSLALLLLYWQWRPLPEPAWAVANPLGAAALSASFWAGWGIVLISTFLLDHFELFGLRQVWSRARGEALPAAQFRMPLFYRFVRHPIYLGFIIAFWSAAVMSQGHLLFALATTSYIFVGILLEERDLVAHFGESYVVYRKTVWMILPLPPSR